jgi:hypothetical protein
VKNCERYLFQRPDDAIHRGYDGQAEADIALPDSFMSNFAPLVAADARELVDDAIGFSAFTAPMQRLIQAAADAPGRTHRRSTSCPRRIRASLTASRLEEPALPAVASRHCRPKDNGQRRTGDAPVPQASRAASR